jgi:hypothetical protein
MLVGLPIALMMLAQATGVSGPMTVSSTKSPQPSATAGAVPDCSPRKPDPSSREIVICAEKPDGYRVNPDVLEAKRELRSGGRPRPPEDFKQNNCATIGPMGCRGTYFNVMAAAVAAAEMADRLSKGEEVGSLLVTDPHPSEYQLYLEAKKRREEREAEVRAKAAAAARQAQAAAATGAESAHQ